jgi:hypothetical protein
MGRTALFHLHGRVPVQNCSFLSSHVVLEPLLQRSAYAKCLYAIQMVPSMGFGLLNRWIYVVARKGLAVGNNASQNDSELSWL